VKTAILALGTLSLFLAASATANDLDDAYQRLKDAQTAKDPDAIKKAATETAKLAKAEVTGPKLEGFSDEDWPKRVEFAKGVGATSEYALSTAAAQPGLAPEKVVELMDTLLAVNPKSTYIGVATNAYLAALGKMGGADKQIEGATKIVNGSPNEEEALVVLADNLMAKNRADQAYTYASRLVTVMKSKAKPEGYSDEDWNRRKSTLLSRGYYTAGVTGCMRQVWKDCDTNLRAALPLVGNQPGFTGPAYFYLGVANYQISKITTDRTKLQEALKFEQQSAAIAGPMQAQAQQYVTVMQGELRAPVVRR
jgi:tetratricopeptide (TPR) repeat protein